MNINNIIVLWSFAILDTNLKLTKKPQHTLKQIGRTKYQEANTTANSSHVCMKTSRGKGTTIEK